ncbi:MAG: hypothetical protein ACOVSR_05895 [Bacteroidia bacterium]
MEEKSTFMEPLFERAEAYGKSSFELLKLKALQKSASIISVLTVRIILVLFMVLVILNLNIGVALWLGNILNNMYFGFFCVAAFYLVIVGILCVFLNKFIQKRINQSIINQILTK